MNMAQEVSIRTPDTPPHESFTDPKKAVERLQELYATAVKFLSENFVTALSDGQPETRVRAFYPEIRLTTTTYAKTDTRLSFGHVAYTILNLIALIMHILMCERFICCLYFISV